MKKLEVYIGMEGVYNKDMKLNFNIDELYLQ